MEKPTKKEIQAVRYRLRRFISEFMMKELDDPQINSGYYPEDLEDKMTEAALQVFLMVNSCTIAIEENTNIKI